MHNHFSTSIIITSSGEEIIHYDINILKKATIIVAETLTIYKYQIKIFSLCPKLVILLFVNT